MVHTKVNIFLAIILLVLFTFCCSLPDQKNLYCRLYSTDSVPASAIAAVAGILKDSLNINVQVGRVLSPPDSIWSETRHRYKAANMLKWIAQLQNTDNTHFEIIITDMDLGVDYNGEYLRGIHGLSVQGGGSGAISDYRLHQLGRPRDSIDYYLGKVALHEAGHMLGLFHCKTAGCIMESVEIKQHITTLGSFCPQCKKNISEM